MSDKVSEVTKDSFVALPVAGRAGGALQLLVGVNHWQPEGLQGALNLLFQYMIASDISFTEHWPGKC